ncbi:hypothetical protein I5Q34_19890 [Streptomyces sp. AV19]|uniref:hypothetical protein n=1 Tax=Streptomyces sp. AV19 TaxID=2793068 RepID=UPI0018FEB886|nr:hypothetical protein [Streptomyces sp. AV19]MBH1936510.1 hypothetical protein [Streptomyces sp. AV19]MDG4532569.1 hypothetical protein [Streptomyces sp. AV19]
MKQWVKAARVRAREAGEHPPVPYSGLSQTDRAELWREAQYWLALANGDLLKAVVPRRPTAEDIRARRAHLTSCCARLHDRMETRGDLLPEGTRDQLATVEQRIAVAIDVVEHAPAEWSREADAAWHELTQWAHRLDTDPRKVGAWVWPA